MIGKSVCGFAAHHAPTLEREPFAAADRLMMPLLRLPDGIHAIEQFVRPATVQLAGPALGGAVRASRLQIQN